MDRGEFPHLTDSQFESVRKMAGIFGGEALRSLAAATPTEQVERIKVFDTYERGLIAHVHGLQAPVAEMKPAQPKLLRLKVNPYEGKEGENLHFWSGEDLGVHARRDVAGLFTTWAHLWKREVHEYIQEMRILVTSLVGNPLPEPIKVTVFTDGLKVGPSRTQLFRVHANTMEEAIRIDLQEEYSHRQARTPTSVWQGHNASSGAVQGAPAAGASMVPVPMELVPESMGALETRKNSGGLLVVHASAVARNSDKYADALSESKGRGQVSVRLADGTVVNVPGVRMDLAVTFEDFDSMESFLVLDMDKYDLIVGMSATYVSSVGNEVPRGVKKTNTSAEVPLSTSRVDNQVPHSEAETPSARSVEEQCHVFDGVSGRQGKADAVHLEALPEVSALLNLEELSMKDFLAELKAGAIAEMVLLKPETSPEDLNSSSVMDEDVLEGFTKQRATRLGSEILKNPEDPVYSLVKEYSDVVSKHPPSQLPPDRGCEVIDAFFAEKAMHRRRSRKDVLLNNMSGCTLYSALDLVDGYYQILMRESDIPFTAVSTPSGMLWEWLVMSHGLSNIPVTFNRLVIQL
ncbi:Pol protein, partial [Phytophthora palmivora]